MGGPASGGGSQRKRKKREERQAQAERDKQKRMAKTGRAVAAPAPVNRRKDSREPESMLSEELTAELMQEGTGMSVEDFIFDPKAPKPVPAPKPSAVEVKMSNSQAKKLERLAKRKELEVKRVEHLQMLQKNALGDQALGLLHSSGRLGQTNSKKESLKLELQRQRAGFAPDESVRLTQELGSGTGSAPPLEDFEPPQAFGNRYRNPENAKPPTRPAGAVELVTHSTMMPDGRGVALLPNVTALPSMQAKPFGDVLPPAPKSVVRTQAKPFGDILPPAPAPAAPKAGAPEPAALPPRPMLVRQLSGVDGVRSLPRSPKAPAAATATAAAADQPSKTPTSVDDPSGNAAKRARRHPGNHPEQAAVKAAKDAGTWVPGLLPHQQPTAQKPQTDSSADSSVLLSSRPSLKRQVSGVDGVRTLQASAPQTTKEAACATAVPQSQSQGLASISLIPTLTGDKEADEEALAEAETHVKVEIERAAVRAAEAAASAPTERDAAKTEQATSEQAVWIQVKRKRKVQKARMELPVCAEEQRVMEAVTENNVVIVVGETGSGKTTQIPQFLFEAGYGQRRRELSEGAGPGQARHMMIGCTQPRRVAAYSMAKRVAYELNVPFGDVVGYQVRHESNVTRRTSIKFMTDGVLLRELEHDLLLPNYSVILLDEAHERTLNTDLLLGLLPRVVKLRANKELSRGLPPLKLVIMSATVAAEEMAANAALFPTGPPPILHINARQHPVTMHFSKRTELGDYVTRATDHVSKIHKKLPHGGILVFLTGAHEVELACKKLRQMFPKKRKEKKPGSHSRGDKRPGDWECKECGVNNFADRIVCFKCGEAKPMSTEDQNSTTNPEGNKHLLLAHGSEGGGDSGDEEQPTDDDDDDKDEDESAEGDSDSGTDTSDDEGEAGNSMDVDSGTSTTTVSSLKRRRERTDHSPNMNAVTIQCQGRPRRSSGAARVSVVEMDAKDANLSAPSPQKADATVAVSESTSHPGAFWGMSLDEVYKQDASDIFDIMSSSSEDDESESDEDERDSETGGSRDKTDETTGDSNEDMRTARERRRERRKKKLAEKAAKAQAKLEKGAEETKEDEDEEDERAKAPLHVLPLYSMLPSDQQQRVFKPPPPGCRLVVVATNVAETSITIPGIRYVIDAGRAKQKVFAEGSDSVYGYKVHWISKAGAKQRAGRAGRTGPGHCYRLYSSAVFDHHFAEWSTPEMSVMPLDAICLRLKCLGLKDVSTFPFPTAPPPEALSRAVSVLRVLGLLDDDGLPTNTGREVSAVPASPRLGLMLVLARRWGCSMYGAAVVAALSVGDPCMYGRQQVAHTAVGEGAEDEKMKDTSEATTKTEDLEGGEEQEDIEEETPLPPMLPAQVAFGDAHSDVLRVVNALGAYEYERAMAIKDARADMQKAANSIAAVDGVAADDKHDEEANESKKTKDARAKQVEMEESAANAVGKAFCDQYNINHKLLKEILSLKAQLIRDTADGVRAKQLRKRKGEPEDITQQLLPPPDADQKLKLRKLIVAGFIDRVARLKPIGDMPHHPTRGAAYIPCRQGDGTEIEGGITGVAAGGARLVWLHRGSALHSTRTDDPPEWIVYQEVMEGRNRGGDGRAEKRYLKQITALGPEWLAELACADGGKTTTPLCRLSAPLQEPAPYYSSEVDAVLCYVRPSFGFGGTAWPLPLHPCVMSTITGAREPGSASEYAVFGKALLEGLVLDGLAPLQPFWVGAPTLMVRPNAETDGKVRDLVSALRRAQVASRSALLRKLKDEPKFLLPALQR